MDIELSAIEGLPEIGEGDDLAALIAERTELEDGDVLVISQKAVSKAEGRVRRLGEVTPGDRALELAAELDKDPALVELILAESRSIVRSERGVLIVETNSGWICANAGIDASNVAGEDAVALLPSDPDASARSLRKGLRDSAGVAPAIIVSDSFGRPWRIGQSDVAIGCAGLSALDDWRGRVDREGRELAATAVAVADQLAAAADLTRDKASGYPVVRIRGAAHLVASEDGPGAAEIQRPAAEDLFR
jgi:coenzyme F420-0:L-glutamate ligase / coenzyme F420-1:gamma-L-glutamate ligase